MKFKTCSHPLAPVMYGSLYRHSGHLKTTVSHQESQSRKSAHSGQWSSNVTSSCAERLGRFDDFTFHVSRSTNTPRIHALSRRTLQGLVAFPKLYIPGLVQESYIDQIRPPGHPGNTLYPGHSMDCIDFVLPFECLFQIVTSYCSQGFSCIPNRDSIWFAPPDNPTSVLQSLNMQKPP